MGGIGMRLFSRNFEGVLMILACLIVIISVSTVSAQSSPTPPPASTPSDGSSAGQPSTGDQSGSQSTPVSGQQPDAQAPTTPDQSSMFVFKKQVEEVVLHVTVTDDQHHMVPSLPQSAFAVFENGVPEAITSFRREDVPVAMGIVVDNSGSMRDKREKINQAVLNLIRASNPHDEIFVVNFNESSYLDQDFTSDVNLLQAALRRVSLKGTTALYDAVVASSKHLNSANLEKKVLLVITDGQDNMSQETLQESSRQLQQPNGPTIYAIGLTGSRMRQDGQQPLQQLAQGTGGVAYFPETLDQVDEITRTVAHDIRSQYMLTYRPKNQNVKPEYQSVRVEAHAPGYGKLTVRTKTGYYHQNATR
jgi:Ca-activated chloride channel homolog